MVGEVLRGGGGENTTIQFKEHSLISPNLIPKNNTESNALAAN